MYYPVDLCFLTHKYADLLTNDEWDLVNCGHCEAHNEPEKCP